MKQSRSQIFQSLSAVRAAVVYHCCPMPLPSKISPCCRVVSVKTALAEAIQKLCMLMYMVNGSRATQS